jgi:hypothetical protein
MTVKNAIHIYVTGRLFSVMILIDGIYEEYAYDSWPAILAAHPIYLGYSKDVHIFVRGSL